MPSRMSPRLQPLRPGPHSLGVAKLVSSSARGGAGEINSATVACICVPPPASHVGHLQVRGRLWPRLQKAAAHVRPSCECDSLESLAQIWPPEALTLSRMRGSRLVVLASRSVAARLQGGRMILCISFFVVLLCALLSNPARLGNEFSRVGLI